jgi:RHS repeat-associated protein
MKSQVVRSRPFHGVALGVAVLLAVVGGTVIPAVSASAVSVTPVSKLHPVKSVPGSHIVPRKKPTVAPLVALPKPVALPPSTTYRVLGTPAGAAGSVSSTATFGGVAAKVTGPWQKVGATGIAIAAATAKSKQKSRVPRHPLDPIGDLTVPSAKPSASSVLAGPALGSLNVRLLTAKELGQYGLTGVGFQLTRAAGSTAGPIAMQIPRKYLVGQFGANYSSRVQWRQVSSGSAVVSAQASAPVASVMDATSANEVITPDLLSQSEIVAAASSPTSTTGTGNFAATPLNAAGSWDESAQTGDFTWTMPFRTPPAAAGPSPSSLGLNYDSQSADGETGGTNNQPSSVGQGWTLAGGGNIQRQYVSCAQDDTPVKTSGDLCWHTNNATLTLDGHSSELVQDATTGQWKLLHDDGTKVVLINSSSPGGDPCSSNADNDHECWEVTTTDGTEYFFGRNELPGWTSGKPQTNSTWTVPVFGNDAGEPCHASTFATSSCTQAWQWNLDYVMDVHGNAEALYYYPETNKYNRNGSTSTTTSYIRGGALKEIDYGLIGTGSTPNTYLTGATGPSDAVLFNYNANGRCATSCTSEAITATPTTPAHPTNYPDVPWDLLCTGSTCTSGDNSPSFWTDAELNSVTTEALVSGVLSPVDSWTLAHNFTPPIVGDATSASLWLASVAHQGVATPVAGTPAVSEPLTSFVGEALQNRVWGSGDPYTPLDEYRISGINTSLGGQIVVNYSAQQCTYANMASIIAAAASNTSRCFPAWWTPGGATAPVEDLFHKYVVTSVVSNPETGGGADASLETDYDYSAGHPAWRYNKSAFTPTKYRTWSDFAGYDKVRINTGSASSPTTQKSALYTFFQGMNGDRSASGGTKPTAYVDGSSTLVDQPWFAGRTYEEQDYNGAQAGLDPMSTTITTPTASGPTATSASGSLLAYMVGDGDSVTTEATSDAGSRTQETKTTYSTDGYFLPAQVESTTSDAADSCTNTSYAAANTTAWIIGLPSEVAIIGTTCAAAPTATYPDADISDTKTAYDGLAVGAMPTAGDTTSTQIVDRYDGSTASTAHWTTQSTSTYDSLGREIMSTDILGRHTTYAFTPAAAGPLTSETVTAPGPTSTGAGWATVTAYYPQWGLAYTTTDPNGETTTEAYDALGRLTGVWKPDRATTLSASIAYTYTLSTTAANSVLTSTLGPASTLKTYDLYDGLGRVVQSQTAAEGGGSDITDTAYDSLGNVGRTNNKYWTNSVSPSSALFVPTSEVQIPSETLTQHDGAGRVTTTTLDTYGVQFSQTTTSYNGADETDVTPVNGGTPTSTFTNSLGQVTKLVQYLASAPSGSSTETTQYGYDAQGHMTTMTDPDSNIWTWSYDVLGHKLAEKTPDASQPEYYTYDDSGNLQSSTDARNKTLTYTDDNLGRTTAEFSGSGSSAVQLAGWTYDPTGAKGQLASSTSYVGATAGAPVGTTGLAYTDTVTGYNLDYEPTGDTVSIPSGAPAFGGTTYTTGQTYNVADLPQATNYPAAGGLPSESVRTSYDGVGNANSVGTSATAYVNVSYNPLGQVGVFTRPGATILTTSFAYVAATNSVAEIQNATQTGTATQLLADSTYGYDDAGNVTSIATNSSTLADETQCFTYDYLQNLTNAWTPGSGNCAGTPDATALSGPAPYWESFNVDPATGNRTQETQYSATSGLGTATNYCYNGTGPHAVSSTQSDPCITSSDAGFTYDAAGDTLTTPDDAMTYDDQGRVSTTTSGGNTESNVYDANGTLLLQTDSSTGATLFLGATELHLANGGSTASGVRTYSANGTPVAERTTIAGVSGSDLQWLGVDAQGTANIEVDSVSGAVNQRLQDPYGNSRGTAVTWSSDHNFLNAPQSTATGLTQLGARVYDSVIGKFLTLDAVQAPLNPEQNNGYTYSANSPITMSDPSGKCYNAATDSLTTGTHCAGGTGATKNDASTVQAIKKLRSVAKYAVQKLTEWQMSPAALALYVAGQTNSDALNNELRWGLEAKNGNVWSGIQAVANAGDLGGREATASALELFQQFASKGPWDLKPFLKETYNLSGSDFVGARGAGSVRADVFGNVNYGVMMSEFGVTEDNAIGAADASVSGTGVADPEDDTAVKLGYSLVKQYPGGYTSEQYLSFIVKHGVAPTVLP